MLLKPNLNQLFSHHLQHKSTLFKHQHKTHQPTSSWFVYISPSVDEDGEIIEFFDSDQWQEHQASIATSTALASAATASPEAADQQHKRAHRIAHPSDPLTPLLPEIAPLQPERCVASKALRTTTTAAEDSNGTLIPQRIARLQPPIHPEFLAVITPMM